MTTLLATRGDSLVDYANKLHVAPALLAAPEGICEWLTDQVRNNNKILFKIPSRSDTTASTRFLGKKLVQGYDMFVPSSQCIVVYLASESRNSLKLLHAVTSTWALSRLVHSLEENNLDLKMRLIQTHLCSLLALYVALNKPRYDKSRHVKLECITT